MTKIGYYPGCSLLGTAREYDESLRAILPRMGVELVDVPDWNCCGASSAHMLNHELSLSLPARILSSAENKGITDMLVPCAACYNRFVMTIHELNEDSKLRARVADITGLDYRGTIHPLNILEFLEKRTDAVKAATALPFERNVACYYGCLLVRPPTVMKFDRSEDPRTMDDLMSAVGANPVDWAFKVECCGAGLSITSPALVGKLSGRIIENAVKSGAEAIIVACPLCHANLDMRRSAINKAAGKKYTVPVLYITQAVGLAMGLKEKELGLHRHLVKVRFPADRGAAQAPTHAQPAADSEPAQTEEA
ncbi:MAG: heterodisulfide reductase subunit B [Spirochaetes bacterium RBG_16_49_21]|nr:MAG: heterodisulfide reductase subunit B [Spirochaetes bacterium RBG_16_49_21]